MNLAKEHILLAAIILSVSFQQVHSDGKLLFPVKEGQDVALVIIAGFNCTFQQYEDLGIQVQNDYPYRLWVYLSDSELQHYSNDTITGNAKQMLISSGFPEEAPLFSSGHNYGASMVAYEEIKEFPDLAVGVILIGASILYEKDSDMYPRPLMTVNGDIDGNNRISKVAKDFRYQHYEIEENDNNDLKYMFPNVILEGVNHAQFITGQLPGYVESFWIEPEVTDDKSRELISQATIQFMIFHSTEIQDDRNQAKEMLERYYIEMNYTVVPIYIAFDAESSPTDAMSPWSEKGQEIIADLEPQYREITEFFDTEFSNMTELKSSRPNVTIIDANSALVECFSHNLYLDPTLTRYESAYMLQSKFKSKQAIMEEITGQPYDFVAPKDCKDINQEAWSWVLNSLSGEKQRERYYNKNISVTFLDDDMILSGPEWINSSIVFDFNGEELIIQSTAVHTRNRWEIKSIEGMHYCKIVSPAKFLEFIYVDVLYTISFYHNAIF